MNERACPACAESVESAIEKCPYCGEFLSERPPIESSGKKTLLIICAVVFAILFVVVLVVVGNMFVYYRGAISGSRDYTAAHTKAWEDMQAIKSAIKLYQADLAALPSGLDSLITDPGTSSWKGPYLAEPASDPWGRPYGYTLAETGVTFTLSSLGADGQPGGTVLDEDISLTVAK